MNIFSSVIKGWRNDGTDPKKNDAWRVLLFAFNNTSSVALTNLCGYWDYYIQNVLELGTFLITASFITTIVDAVIDPFLATHFDRFESKHGKYKPFMFVGCMLTVLPVLVIFCYPKTTAIPKEATFAILLLMNAIKAVGTSILMTVTTAGQAVITQDPRQRPLYSLGQTVFDAAIAAFVTLVIKSNIFGSMQSTFVWRLAVLVLSLLSVVLNIFAMVAISNRDNPTYYKVSKSNEKLELTEFWNLVKRSKAFRCLLAATASDSVAASMRAKFTIYLFATIIMERSLSATFDLVSGAIIGAPAILFGVLFASKKGSSVVYSKISVIQTILPVTAFILCVTLIPCDPNYKYSGFSLPIFIVLFFFGLYMSTLGISTNLVKAMQGDLADYEYYEHGKFIPGTIGATMSFVTTVFGSTVSLMVSGVMLFCGLGEVGTKIPENVFVNERFYYCVLICIFLLPAIGHFITWIAMKNYPLDDKKMEEVSSFLAKERGLLDGDEEKLPESDIKETEKNINSVQVK